MNQQLILLVVAMAALFYLLIYRPQSKAKRAREDLDRTLAPGRRAVTAGGIHGEIRALDGETVDLEIAAGVVITVDRRAITALTDEPEEEWDEDDEDEDEDAEADEEHSGADEEPDGQGHDDGGAASDADDATPGDDERPA